MRKFLNRIDGGPMGRPMHIWTYGHFGPPLIAFPSASGMAHEWDNHGMVEALAPLINQGLLKLYTVESNVSEAWTRKENPPAWRIKRHQAYEQWLTEQLVPWVYRDLGGPMPLSVSGVSLGAFYAANAVLKHPMIFQYALCMSGRYDTYPLAGQLNSTDVYYNNPMAYVAGLHGEALEVVASRVHLDLICGQGKWEDGNFQETEKFHKLLQSKGIPSHLDLWGKDVAHEWVWWRRQAEMYLGKRFSGVAT